MAETGQEMLAELAVEMAFPVRTIIGPDMTQLAQVDLRPMSPEDQAVMKATFAEALRRTSREFGDGSVRTPDPRAVSLALVMSRQRLMSPDSALTNAGRDFVAAHCPCG